MMIRQKWSGKDVRCNHKSDFRPSAPRKSMSTVAPRRALCRSALLLLSPIHGSSRLSAAAPRAPPATMATTGPSRADAASSITNPNPTSSAQQLPKKKKLDSRVNALINNAVISNHRSFFILVGDRGRNQVVNLHFLLSQSRHTARPNVLWCYKKELGFTSNRKKREAKVKRDVKRGAREVGDMDPFELFVSVTDIRYT